MNSWFVDWHSLGIVESGVGFVVFLDHSIEYENDCSLKIDPVLFEINTPFYMDSELWWKSDTQKAHKSITDRQTYIKSLSEKERKLIDWVKSQICSNSGNVDGDNSRARAKAMQIHLRSSGINCNHQDDVYSNPSDSSVIIKIAFQDYIIPRQSCFAIFSVQMGLHVFSQYLMKYDENIAINEKFLIIIDPPWENKSVKRKRNYKTSGVECILQDFYALNEVCKLLFNRHKLDIRVAFWTTEKFKSLCIEKLLPAINMKLEASLLWHKITHSWESIKIRGGREYLLIASQNGRENILEGVLISKPSAIHSHKPPIGFDFPWLQEAPKTIKKIKNIESSVRQANLHKQKFTKLKGIELYARYLRSNFFSIGYECVKLQTIDVFQL